MKALIVTNIARPYRHALFEEMAARLAGCGSLTVAYTSDPSAHRRRREVRLDTSDAPYEIYQMEGFSLPIDGDGVISMPRGVGPLLDKVRPEVAVIGGFGLDVLAIHNACHRRAIPTLVWAGSWPGGERKVSAARKVIRSWLVRRAAGAIAYGSSARQYLVDLGADPDRVWISVNTVQLERFRRTATEARANRSSVAQRYGLRAKNMVCVGHLTPRKGVGELMQAVALVGRRDEPWALHFVGSGPFEPMLRKAAPGLEGVEVRFHGFLQEHDVARICGASDFAVCPTLQDIWCLTINEELACGLPVISSCFAGATKDLIDDGVNGFVIDPRNAADMANRIRLLLADDALRMRMSRAAESSASERASLARSADTFIEAMERCIA